MTEPPRRYDVTITVDQDGGHYPNPAEFAVVAQCQLAKASSRQPRRMARGNTESYPEARR